MIQLVGRLDETARRKLDRKPIAHLQILSRSSALVRVQCEDGLYAVAGAGRQPAILLVGGDHKRRTAIVRGFPSPGAATKTSLKRRPLLG